MQLPDKEPRGSTLELNEEREVGRWMSWMGVEEGDCCFGSEEAGKGRYAEQGNSRKQLQMSALQNCRAPWWVLLFLYSFSPPLPSHSLLVSSSSCAQSPISQWEMLPVLPAQSGFPSGRGEKDSHNLCLHPNIVWSVSFKQWRVKLQILLD